jgi:hypothetical protein
VRFVSRGLGGNLGGCGFRSGLDLRYGLGLRFSHWLWLDYNFRCSFDRRLGFNCGFNRRGLCLRYGWGIGVQRGYFDYFGCFRVGRGFERRLLLLRRRL